MSLANTLLLPDDSHTPAARSPTERAMEIGQYVIAIVLTAIGTVRAISGETAAATAVIAAIAILAWHSAGTLVPFTTQSRRAVIGWLMIFAAVWITAVAVSAEFIWLAFLLWLLAGHVLPVRWGLIFSTAILAVVVAAPILHYGTTTYANVVGPLIGGCFAYGISRGYLQLLRDAAERERLVTSLTRAQREMSELQDELASTQRHSGAIAERTRISRDIHDTIAQALSSIRLLAHAEAHRTTDLSAARTLQQIVTLAGDSLGDTRRIVAALVPAELEDGALAAALRRMLHQASEQTGVHVDLHVDDSLPLLTTETEVALLRTAQSALANVRLHADASRVVTSLVDANDSVRLDITDDGAGFDVTAWEQSSDATSSSYGLRFMRARLRELGGGLDIESAPGEGTAISMHLPIHPTTEETP